MSMTVSFLATTIVYLKDPFLFWNPLEENWKKLHLKFYSQKSMGISENIEISVKRDQSVEFKFVFGKIGVKSLLHIHTKILKKSDRILFFEHEKIFGLKNLKSEKHSDFLIFFEKFRLHGPPKNIKLPFYAPNKFNQYVMVITFDWDRF